MRPRVDQPTNSMVEGEEEDTMEDKDCMRLPCMNAWCTACTEAMIQLAVEQIAGLALSVLPDSNTVDRLEDLQESRSWNICSIVQFFSSIIAVKLSTAVFCDSCSADSLVSSVDCSSYIVAHCLAITGNHWAIFSAVTWPSGPQHQQAAQCVHAVQAETAELPQGKHAQPQQLPILALEQLSAV